MAKKNGKDETMTEQPATVAPATKAEFMVPPTMQGKVREIDTLGANLQKELGGLELQYVSRKNQLLQAFEENRKTYDSTLRSIAKGEGVDLEKVGGAWTFDFATMTFKKSPEPPAPTA